MANLVDIAELAESLESQAIHVVEDRCVVVRNRNAKCRKCHQVCPVEALTISDNTLLLDHSACISCGACSVVCPTEALIPLRPLDKELVNSIVNATLINEGKAVFACARIAAKRLVNHNSFAEVPCLARIEESLLCGLAAQGIENIFLVDGVCSTCKYHACEQGINETVESANTLIRAMGGSSEVLRLSRFPAGLSTENVYESYGVSRRRFFSRTKGEAKMKAGKTASTILDAALQEKVATLQQRLGITEVGSLPRFEAIRRITTLDAMDCIGRPVVIEIDTRLWGNVHIDSDTCNACHMCTVFCPTGALEKVKREEGGTGIAFTPSLCVQCRTCEDICLKKCLTVSSVVPLKDLFSFEPRVNVPSNHAEGHNLRNGII